MADEKPAALWYRRPLDLLGRVGLVFVVSVVLFVSLAFLGHSSGLLVLDSILMLVTGAWLAGRGLVFVSRHSLWSLRNRLLVVYALTGVLPILLILLLVGFGGWALTSELAIHLASSELDRRFAVIHSAAETLSKLPLDSRKYAGPGIVSYFKVRFPGISLYEDDAAGVHSYPEGVPPLNLPAGWHDASGLLERGGQFYGWAHIEKNGERFTAMAPLSDELIADLVPNLGQIVLSETAHKRRNIDSRTETRSTEKRADDFGEELGNFGKKSNSKNAEHFAIHNAGRVPQPVNRFDLETAFVASYPHYDWNDPNDQHSALLMVRSRPSAVFSAIFTGKDLARSLLIGAMIAVTISFLVVEIIALVIGVSLSRRITRSVNEIYEGTRRVIYGDFRHRIPVRSSDQLGELSTSFNQMTGNLERLLSVEKEKERLQAELEIAREVQTRLYPKSMPLARCLRLTVHCEPARVVSGDYYDYENLGPNELAFAIGDVAGKGISAALLMATLQAGLRAQISASMNANSLSVVHVPLDSAQLVSDLNKQVYAHSAPEKYATFFFGVYDDVNCTLTYTNAGHLPPILIRKGQATTLDVNGTVVGAFPAVLYDKSVVSLEPGDLLVCYTDGITEPENAYGEMFGEDRLIDLVARSASEDDESIIRKVIDAVRNWHSAPELPDDMTLMIARRLEIAV
jgi:sigma-B regulation protein RsbU (phosphoserine phosphatase)